MQHNTRTGTANYSITPFMLIHGNGKLQHTTPTQCNTRTGTIAAPETAVMCVMALIGH